MQIMSQIFGKIGAKGEMNLRATYSGSLTREQFLIYEMRIVAKLQCQGYDREQILNHIFRENAFQFPTERTIVSITGTCLRRLEALDSPHLVQALAESSMDVSKQINLYAMMRDNRIVWDFMTTVIGEKYRTQDFEFGKKDLNLFFMRLSEQVDGIAGWSDTTVAKIKQVLTKCLVECGYLEKAGSTELKPVCICPELETGIRENNDAAAFAAFNYFE